ncbi:MAG: T9SS type A sorting domain-containing protein [Candidatus Latescibacteria bacterium]|nr:T9SS type A sorting domain-containing protein [Candidatus Latescibacterota bacterium]
MALAAARITIPPSAGSFLLAGLLVLTLCQYVHAGQFLCAEALQPPRAKSAAPAESVRALVLFATFADGAQGALPGWSGQLFAADRPGSLRHFYATMSGGRLQLDGDVAPQVYRTAAPAAAYVAHSDTVLGGFGDFVLDILTQADAHIDWRQYDSDGLDGVPNSGDDDGFVDAVFIVVERAPSGFILGPATGVGNLGLKQDFITADRGISGLPVRVHPGRGTLQQGRSFNEAVGAMAHEYGHVLGLPDLFNTAWLQSGNNLPEEDSAGIGRWGLMGWGALGWLGDDGPTSFSAWSRLQLGWAETVEPQAASSVMQLEDVGRGGQLGLVYLGRQSEYFLVEYRTPKSSYYDRHIPAAGLLVWHVERGISESGRAGRVKVDLECADGRWQEAGFPLGQTAAPEAGDDNLDFWAHDREYARRHGGNLGDATDPFDGERFATFDAQTNPAANRADGGLGMQMRGIQLEGDRASFALELQPPAVRISRIGPTHDQAMAGQEVAIAFGLKNEGGLEARNLRARLVSQDDWVEIIAGEITLKDLPVGIESLDGGVGDRGFPRLRFPADLQETRSTKVRLEIYADSSLVDSATVEVTGVPGIRLRGTVRNTRGEGLEGVPVFFQEVPSKDRKLSIPQGLQYPQQALTGLEGSYQVVLPSATYYIIASPLESQPWERKSHTNFLFLEQDSVVDFTLQRTFLLQGIVTNPAGEPVGGISVIADSGGRTYYSLAQADGTYDLKVPAGVYTISSGIETVEKGGYAPFRLEGYEILADGELDIQMAQGVLLTVRVEGPRGEGVEGVDLDIDVWQEAYQPSILTDHQGQVQMRLPPGALVFHAIQVPIPYLPAARLPVKLTADTTVVLKLDRGAVVEGSLLNAGGSDFPGAQMLWSNLDREAIRWVNVEVGTGHYALALAPGRYRVQVHFTDRGQATQVLGEVMVGTEGLVRDFLVRPGVLLRGRITRPDGRGLGGSIRLTPQGGDSAFAGFLGTSGLLSAAGYAVSAVPGRYEVRAYIDPPNDRLWVGWTELYLGTVLLEEETQRDWTAPRLIPFSGQVAGADSLIAAKRLQVQIEGLAASGRVIPDETGRFVLEVPQGSYGVILAQWQGLGQSRWLAGQVDGANMQSLTLLYPPGRLQGRLPVEQADSGHEVLLLAEPQRLHVLADGLAVAQADIDTDGRYQLAAEPGNYALVAYARVLPNGQKRGRVVEDVLVEVGGTEGGIDLGDWEDVHPVQGSIERVGLDPEARISLQFYDPASGVALQLVGVDQDNYAAELPVGRYLVEAGQWQGDQLVRAWLVGAVAVEGPTNWPVRLDPGATVVEGASGPPHFALEQNYPNPFNSATTIPFAVEQAGLVELAIYNAAGQRLRHLQQLATAPGRYQLVWDGRDEAGRSVASGVYFYRLLAGGKRATRRLVLLR